MACFDETCDPEVVASVDAFAALAPVELFAGPACLATQPVEWAISRWVRKRGLRDDVVLNTIMAAMRKYPRLRYAFTQGDFAGWPELDAAHRLGGYEAMLDVVALMILEPKS